MKTTVRIVNSTRQVAGEWYVNPSDPKMLTRIQRELKTIQAEEPGSNWKIQTRGTHADWHDWLS